MSEMASNGSGASVPHHRVAIIGAGFGGLGAAIRLKRAGIEDFVVFERDADVGGTWWANTYPGCQCDVPSSLYSYSFAPNPDWSRTYSKQPEIWEYLRRCAERFGITPHLRLGVDVEEASWDEGERIWRGRTSAGPFTAQVLIGAIGPLSEPSLPEIPGLESFAGTVFHSARWDHEHDLSGERVAVIGTGASAIQFVPKIQPRVDRMHVFQRTPPWVLPHTDRPRARLERWLFRRFPFLLRLNRIGVYWGREWLILGMAKERRLMKPLQLLARLHLFRQVRDRALRRRLRPSYTLGCKRILPTNEWYPALSKPNVELVTEAITEIRPHSIVTADGSEREVDTLVLGTGFHVTDFSGAEAIRGRGGRSLAEVWQGSPQAYLGTAIAGFPNFFMLLGPNTGLGHLSVVFMIEAQIEHIFRCLREMENRELASVEVRADVQQAFNAEIQEKMPGTVWVAGGCASWYIDRNGLNTTIWPDFTWRFDRRTRSFDPDDYVLEPAADGAEAARRAEVSTPGSAGGSGRSPIGSAPR